MLAACRAGATQAAQIFGRAFGGAFRLTVGDSEAFKRDALDASAGGPGLLLVYTVGEHGAVAWILQSSGILPDWVKKPDTAGRAKISGLAREFGRLIFPSGVASMECRAEAVEDCKAAILRGQPAATAVAIPLTVSAGERQAKMLLVLPLEAPRKILPGDDDDEPTPDSHAASHAGADDAPFGELPTYTRSLLRIRVPVRVTLAEKRALVEDIVRLGSGSIIQFDKSCDEMLEMEVNNRRIALGEAVKIGDKFGLRITGMMLPDERFHPLTGA
jgi:flagellar motor switch protein FliN